MPKYKVGKVVKGTVTGIETYGIFISLDEFYNGLIHISEVSNDFVPNLNEYVRVGDVIFVKILEVDEELFQLKLSIKNINYKRVRKKYSKILETNLGFNTLKYNLPIWIEKNLKKQKYIDKIVEK